MPSLTLAYRTEPRDADIGAVEDVVRATGATIRWQRNAAYSRTYALVERASEECADAVRSCAGAAFCDRPIIALAVVPSVPEALPPIVHALGGPGAPDGIRSCETVSGSIVVEWDLDRTGLAIVLGLVDLEIARFHARRVNTLLTPLPLEWTARIAADGLRAPQIATNRVLEALLEEAHVVS